MANEPLGGVFALAPDMEVRRMGYGAMQLGGPGVFEAGLTPCTDGGSAVTAEPPQGGRRSSPRWDAGLRPRGQVKTGRPHRSPEPRNDRMCPKGSAGTHFRGHTEAMHFVDDQRGDDHVLHA